MKKATFIPMILLLLIMGLHGKTDQYEDIDPATLPVFTGVLSSTDATIKYEDTQGKYIYIEIDGVLYVYYV